jgi:hypothetical protein
MSAGLIQLVSTGPQDVYITGNPETSFFVKNYKRHTNFSIFNRSQNIKGNPKAGGLSKIRFERYGDLLAYTYLTVSQSGTNQILAEWSNVIQSCDLLIGGQIVDTQDVSFTEEIAIDILSTTAAKSYPASLHGGIGSQSFFYPFRFFFCENWSSCIPMVALQYHDVEIRIRWSENLDPNYIIQLHTCYISLDTDERRIFSRGNDILIYQVQKSVASNEKIQELNFNHPVKLLASSNASTTTQNTLVSRTNKVKLEANGVDITEYNISVPHFTAVPTYYHTEHGYANSENMFFHSFGLNTTKYQPTGTLNFSRLTNFKIHCSENINTPIYAINYNILRVKNGLGGLMYSN